MVLFPVCKRAVKPTIQSNQKRTKENRSLRFMKSEAGFFHMHHPVLNWQMYEVGIPQNLFEFSPLLPETFPVMFPEIKSVFPDLQNSPIVL